MEGKNGSLASTQKIAEAHFFLNLLTEEERRIIGDKDSFDYYLSAFLSAGRTVDYRLRHEQSGTSGQTAALQNLER